MNAWMNRINRGEMALWLLVAAELVLLLPLWIALTAWLYSAWPLLVLPAAAAAGRLLSGRLTRRWSAVLAGTAVALCGGLAAGLHWPALPLAAASALCWWLGRTAAMRIGDDRMYWAGSALYFVSAVAYARIPALAYAAQPLAWLGAACFVLTLLAASGSHLRSGASAGGATALPAGIRRFNRLFLGGLLLVGAALAAGAGDAAGRLLWSAVRGVVQWLAGEPGQPEAPAQPAAPPPAMPAFPPAEAGEPGVFARVLNGLFLFAAAAAGAAALWFALRWLRRSGPLWRRWTGALLAFFSKRNEPAAPPAYQDEERSLFTWEQALRSAKARMRSGWRSPREPGWDTLLDGRAKARWLYRGWLRALTAQGYAGRPELTPRETARDAAGWEGKGRRKSGRSLQPAAEEDTVRRLVEQYERARYGEEEPDAAELADIRSKLKL